MLSHDQVSELMCARDELCAARDEMRGMLDEFKRMHLAVQKAIDVANRVTIGEGKVTFDAN